jgi:hypothetical protein
MLGNGVSNPLLLDSGDWMLIKYEKGILDEDMVREDIGVSSLSIVLFLMVSCAVKRYTCGRAVGSFVISTRFVCLIDVLPPSGSPFSFGTCFLFFFGGSEDILTTSLTLRVADRLRPEVFSKVSVSTDFVHRRSFVISLYKDFYSSTSDQSSPECASEGDGRRYRG